MENNRVGVIVVVVALLGFGGAEVLTSGELADAYICPLTQNVGIFPEGLSDSGKTGYYIDLSGARQGVSCREGRVYEPWILLIDYAKSQGVSIADLLNSPIDQNTTMVQVKGVQGVYDCDISNSVLETYTLCQKNGREVYAGELLIPVR